MRVNSQPGIEYGLWWLAAVVVLPIIDVVLLLAANGVLLATQSPVTLPAALTAAVVLNAVSLRGCGKRLDVSGATVVTAIFVSYLAAVVVCFIFVYTVVAPNLA